MDTESQNVVFNPEGKEWRCCCGCMHVRTGAIVIGILGVMSAVMNAITGTFLSPLTLIFTPLAVIPVALLIYGAHKYNACAMLTHIILQIIGLVGLIIGALVCIIYGAIELSKASQVSYHHEVRPDIDPTWSHWELVSTMSPTKFRDGENAVKTMFDVLGGTLLGVGGACLVVFAIQVWLLCVVCKAYKYVKASQFAGYGQRVSRTVAVTMEKPPAYY